MVLRAIALTVLAYVVFLVAGTAMLLFPSTPHGRMLQSMLVLNSFRDSPDTARANEAFDEWLRIGRQAQVVEATILPAIAAVAVVLATLPGRPLSTQELIIIVVGFIAAQAWRSGDARIELESLHFLGASVFGATLWLGRLGAKRWQRRQV